MDGKPVARVTRHFDCPPERVFDAWTRPELIRKWMVGNTREDEELVSVAADGRVGGRFSFVIRRAGQVLDHNGTYFLFERPRKLAFTWGVNEDVSDESRVTVEIAPNGAGSDVSLTHEMDPKWADYVAQTERGWSTVLDMVRKAAEA